MTTLEAITEVLQQGAATFGPTPADLAAAAFLARYSSRTLEAYRHDLRTYFQWASDAGLEVFGATRGHIELYRAILEERGLALTTIDRRLSTVCGFYRFAHIDGRISANRPSSSDDQGSSPTRSGAWIAGSSAPSSSRLSASTGPTLRSPCFWDSMGSG